MAMQRSAEIPQLTLASRVRGCTIA